jgi:tRNA U55 pseudouridine synthase TruB
LEGKRAYEYARLGQTLNTELVSRPVKVDHLELVEWFDSHSFPAPKGEAGEEQRLLEENVTKRKFTYKPEQIDTSKVDGPACKLRMTVSGGFYVRSLCYDLGMKLDSGAYMAELVRTRQGEFRYEDAVDWEDFVEGGAWEEKVVNVLSGGNRKGAPEEKPEDKIPVALEV